MLTPEQLETRASGIGASEIAAVAGISPWRTPIDVWLTKPSPTRAAVSAEDTDGGPTEVGDVLEPAVIELYRRRTGNAAERPQTTLRHPEHEWVLASPDAIVSPERLVEAKVVGLRMAGDWDDGPPDYVTCQALWQAFVTGAQMVDVAVLIGTDFRVYTVGRDEDLIKDLYEIGCSFWFDRVLTDTPPPPTEEEDRKTYLRKRFQQRSGLIELTGDALERADMLRLAERAAHVTCEEAKARLEGCQADLMELIGEAAGIMFPDGCRYSWKAPESGAVSYKSICEDLAPFGKIPPELLKKHTSNPIRRFQFYPAPKKARKGA